MTAVDPRRRYPAHPQVGDDSARLIDDAVDALILMRAPTHHGDAAAELHALTSLIADAQARLPRVVADARDQQHTWTDIARQLGIGRLRTIARHAGRTAKRRTPLTLD